MDALIYATSEGKKNLERKLDELVSKREEIAHQIKEAREFGDLKENAEWAAAREAQTNLEEEIAAIKTKLPLIKLFSYAKADTSVINIGTRVKLDNMTTRKSETWVITGVIESDPERGYISNETPLGSALIGKKQGEIIEIKMPAGKIKYRVVKIEPAV